MVNNRAESELDRLYGLPLDDFTSARNEAAKQARAEDPQVVDVLAKARKPTRAAWVINQLARSEPQQVRALLRTGDRLRATTSPQALRKATRDQREALDGLVRSARRSLRPPGRPLGTRRRPPPLRPVGYSSPGVAIR